LCVPREVSIVDPEKQGSNNSRLSASIDPGVNTFATTRGESTNNLEESETFTCSTQDIRQDTTGSQNGLIKFTTEETEIITSNCTCVGLPVV
jgi:hypothetical protein